MGTLEKSEAGSRFKEHRAEVVDFSQIIKPSLRRRHLGRGLKELGAVSLGRKSKERKSRGAKAGGREQVWWE